MRTSDLKIIDGQVAGAWIRPRLKGQIGTVTSVVPQGFEAYARVFHPAGDPDGHPARWADVAEICGTTPHREMQWHAILGLADADELQGSYSPYESTKAKWIGSDPPTGMMDLDTLDALSEILAAHTPDSTDCLFGLGTILGWLDSFAAAEMQPLLKLPDGRDYIVLGGPFSAIDQIAYNWSGGASFDLVSTSEGEVPPSGLGPSELVRREAPSLIWPSNRRWFVGTEVDFDSTLIGGDSRTIDAVVGSSKLEAWQVQPTDSLTADADSVN